MAHPASRLSIEPLGAIYLGAPRHGVVCCVRARRAFSTPRRNVLPTSLRSRSRENRGHHTSTTPKHYTGHMPHSPCTSTRDFVALCRPLETLWRSVPTPRPQYHSMATSTCGVQKSSLSRQSDHENGRGKPLIASALFARKTGTNSLLLTPCCQVLLANMPNT